MNYLIEHIVKECQQHREALGNVGKIALEVYIAYLLERLIDHFHEFLLNIFAKAARRVQVWRETAAGVLTAGLRAKAQWLSARLRHVLKSCRIMQREP